MLNGLFFYVPEEDITEYRSLFPANDYPFIKGTLCIHKVSTIPGSEDRILVRNTLCACENCLNGRYSECENISVFNDYPPTIKMKEHVFRKSNEKKKTSTADEEDHLIDLNEEELEEWEEVFFETQASHYIEKDDIAVIKTGDDHSYYLLKLSSSPCETESEITDDYHPTFPPYHRVVEGNYFEVHKESNDGTIFYYVDYKRKAIISAFCVMENCPLPTTITEKRRGKQTEMYVIDNEMHQALCELVNSPEMV